MIKIRLTRMGKKKNPFYRIVVADARDKRDGRFIEALGTYDPLNKAVNINHDLAEKWLSCGAQPTDTVKKLLTKTEVAL